MANSKELFHEVLNKITISDRAEAEAIAYFLLEARLEIDRQHVWSNLPTQADILLLDNDIARINAYEPVQYVTQTAWFCGHRFVVNSHVLIPRPETEQLVSEVMKLAVPSAKIVDVGTGSGCIAVSLALALPSALVYGLDVSEGALQVAQQNAKQLNASVHWIHADFLNENLSLEKIDILVSNPPYIRELEKSAMEPTVLRFEPHLALFVPNHDPLVFYRALARKGKQMLNQDGKIIAEINAQFSKEVKALFAEEGYQQVSLIKDIEGKDRFVCAAAYDNSSPTQKEESA